MPERCWSEPYFPKASNRIREPLVTWVIVDNIYYPLRQWFSTMRTQIDPVYTGYEIKLQCLPFASGERQEVKKRKEGPMTFYDF